MELSGSQNTMRIRMLLQDMARKRNEKGAIDKEDVDWLFEVGFESMNKIAELEIDNDAYEDRISSLKSRVLQLFKS